MSGALKSRNFAQLGSRVLAGSSGLPAVRSKPLPEFIYFNGQRCYNLYAHNSLLEQTRCFLATSSQVQIFKVFQSTSFASSKEEGASKEESGGNAEAADSQEVAKLKESLAELQSKHDDILDKYRRSIAENDNMRKRLTKQIEDAKIFGIQSFCKDLLDVADVLHRAVSAGCSNTDAVNKDMFEGLRLTENQLLQVFKRHGLEQMNPLNEKFDPNKHEALFQIPNPNMEHNTVLDVQKIGYQLHGRTIRPALVGVSKK